MNDEFTPAQFWKGLGSWIGVGLFLAAVAAGIVLGGWSAGWWFSNQNATRSYQQTQNGTSNQDTLRSQVTKNFQLLVSEGVQAAQAKASGDTGLYGQVRVEEAATAQALCDEGTQVNTAVPLPADQTAWFKANCTMGTISPASAYYIPGSSQ